MKNYRNTFLRKIKIQYKIAFLFATLLVLSNTAQAQWVQLGQDVFNNSEADQAISLNANATVFAIGIPSYSSNNPVNGYARIYNKVNDEWLQIGDDIIGEELNDKFGTTISLSTDGSVVAIGAPDNDGNYINSGHVRVFQNNNDVWTQIGSEINGGAGEFLNGVQYGDFSGSSISLSADGTILAIGAPRNSDNGEKSGKVSIYQNINNSWTLIGNEILGEFDANSFGPFFGSSVSLNATGTLVAIGARFHGTNGAYSGLVKIYEYNNADWTQVGQPIVGVLNEYSGTSVSLSDDGSILAIGAGRSQYARVYRNIGNVWTQIGEDILQYSDDGTVEVSLNANGTYLVTGMPGATSNRGISKVFKNINDSWVQVGDRILGDNTAGHFASSVDISADGSNIALVGFGLMPNGIGTDVARVYQNDTVLDIDEVSNVTVSVYPNPTKNNIYINFKQLGDYSFSVYNMFGQEIFNQEKLEIENRIDFSNYASGIYILKIKDETNSTSKNIKIVKQ